MRLDLTPDEAADLRDAIRELDSHLTEALTGRQAAHNPEWVALLRAKRSRLQRIDKALTEGARAALAALKQARSL